MRSVILKPTVRCIHCHMPPRWCICAAQRDIDCPIEIDLLSHPREHTRPSSTGNLIHRILSGSRQHVWHTAKPPTAEEVGIPGRDLWILHPHGRPLPTDADAASVQIVLLDGLWKETAGMARDVASWGKLVNLPMTGSSRFWLRTQQEGGRFSTVEALMFMLKFLGLDAEHKTLQMQFELHVYASLRSRGRTDLAAQFLAGSPLTYVMREFLEQLHTRRPL